MNNPYDQFDSGTATANPYDQFDAQPTAQKSFVDKLFDLAKTPSPQWMQLAEERARAFVEGAGVPGSLEEAKQFVTRSPIQDIKDIYGGITEIPERVRNIGQTLSTSPAATVIRAPLSPEAFGVYGTTAGMLLPAAQKAFKGRAVEAPLVPPEPPAVPLQPNVPEDYARFQPPVSEVPPSTPQEVVQSSIQPHTADELSNATKSPEASVPEPQESFANLGNRPQSSQELPSRPFASPQPEPTQTVEGTQWENKSWDELTPEQQTLAEQQYTRDTGDEPRFAKVADWYVNKQTGEVSASTEEIYNQTRLQPKEVTENASQITSPEELPSEQVRPSVDEGTPLRQQGETAPAQQQTGQEQVQQERAVTSTKNVVTAAEREQRGIAQAEEAAARDFGTTWDDAAKIAQDDPTAGQRLVSELNAKPRALNDTENALLLREQIGAQTEHNAAVDAVNNAPDDATRLVAQDRLATARDRVQAVYDAGKKAGTETGRGLSARRMMANEDYSLAKMEAVRRAANNGRLLNEKQLAQVKQLHDQITELEGRIQTLEKTRKTRESFTKTMREGREQAREAAKAKKGLGQFLEEQATKARERIIARRGRLNVGFDPSAVTDEIIIGASHLAKGVKDFGEWSRQMIADFGERIRPLLKDIFSRAQAFHNRTRREFMTPQEIRLERYKTGISRRMESLQARMEAGDFTKVVKEKTQLDREAFGLRAEYQRTKDRFDTLVERERLRNRPALQKAADTFVKAERALKLTGITTLGKLAGAGVTRLASTPVEEAVGAVLSKLPILSRVAKAAPREGGFNLAAEIKAPTVGLARGIRNIPKVLKGERINEEALYGKRGTSEQPIVTSPLDIPGRVHGVIKSPIKEAERVRSQTKWEAYARKKGMDLSDPAVQQQIGEAAHQDALRSIFMQDNFLSTGWNSLLGSWERSKKFPIAGKAAATVGRFLLPIVKVPTNVAFETATHLGGTLSATGKLMAVMKRGLATIKPEEADMIMRHYKKGMLGVGLFLTGYFNAEKLGGFYQPGDKRKPEDVQWGQARIAGVTIPRWLLHAPAFIVMQAGATASRMTHQIVKKTGEEQGVKAGTLAVAKGLTEEIPFLNEMGRIDKLLANGWEGEKARGQMLQSSTVPTGVKNIAEWMDTQQRRYPKGELDYLKMAIPGLREQVPFEKANARSPLRSRESPQRIRQRQ